MIPEHELLKEQKVKDKASNDTEINLVKLLKTINQHIEYLYDREHTIGYTYLMGIDSLDKRAATFKNKIIPLLQEHFYDDWKKINLVLNDNGFITEKTLEKKLFKENLKTDFFDAGKKTFEIDYEKFEDKNCYVKIYTLTSENVDMNNENQ